MHKVYKKTYEKIEKLKIIVESQQKKIENFIIKKKTNKINRYFTFSLISKKKNINDIINNSSKRRKQFIEINFNNFTKFFIFYTRRNFFNVFMLLQKLTTLINDKNKFFQKRNRLKRMKLNNYN